MNSQAFALNHQPPAKIVRKSCYKCADIRETSAEKCAECGKYLESVLRIRITGAIQIILGGGLLLLMSWLAVWMLNENSNNHFHGDKSDAAFIIFVFGLVAAIGFGTFGAGLWQIVFGKRNKLLMYGMIVLGIAFVAAGFSVFLNK